MKHKKSRITYANVASTLALALVAGGGTAYAAGLIRTDDLARGAVTTPKLAKDAVTGKKVRNGTLRLTDLSPTQRPLTRVVTRTSTFSFAFDDPFGAVRDGTTACADGEVLVGGGHEFSSLVAQLVTSRPATVDGSTPTAGQPAAGWHVVATQNASDRSTTVTVWALCGS